jgi:hypothetical protein
VDLAKQIDPVPGTGAVVPDNWGYVAAAYGVAAAALIGYCGYLARRARAAAAGKRKART